MSEFITIPLTQGKLAIIDAEDLPIVEPFRWFTQRGKKHCFYAVANKGVYSNRERIRMHRLILGAPAHLQVDHINGNGLDNRKVNLRLATASQNCANKGLNRNNTSGFKGVSPNPRRAGWVGHITINHRRVNLGSFADPEEAARAYDTAAVEAFGEFAYLNFPEEVSR